MITIHTQWCYVLNGGCVILDTTSVAARICHHDVGDAQRTGKVVVLPDRDSCGAGAWYSHRNSVLEPGEVERQISGGHDALDAGPVVDVQVLGERERCDFRRNCSPGADVTVCEAVVVVDTSECT